MYSRMVCGKDQPHPYTGDYYYHLTSDHDSLLSMMLNHLIPLTRHPGNELDWKEVLRTPLWAEAPQLS
ncbi:hypothetical protein QQP08_012992 [Theobroma cacao]|nr:hypothetical protein QQP08_012992 [Theobroma cacao]